MSRWLITSDWHLRPETADTVFEVLEKIDDIVVAEKLDGVIHLGDLYHLRYAIDVNLQNALVDRIRGYPPFILLPGNHDQCDVHGRNALEVLGHMNNVVVMNKPGWSDPSLFQNEHLWLPYRKNIGDYRPALEMPAAPNVNTAFVHHGLVGAKMNTHVVAGEKDGIPPAWFNGFQNVFLGHWHQHQTIGNCTYVGSPWQTRADEAGQEKGVIIWDEDGTWNFVSLRAGRRFHSFAHGAPVDPQPGDQIRVPASVEVAPSVLESYRDAGVEVWEEPKPTSAAPRLGLSAGAGLREHAAAYSKDQAGDLDPARLMDAFDFLTEETTS